MLFTNVRPSAPKSRLSTSPPWMTCPFTVRARTERVQGDGVSNAPRMSADIVTPPGRRR